MFIFKQKWWVCWEIDNLYNFKLTRLKDKLRYVTIQILLEREKNWIQTLNCDKQHYSIKKKRLNGTKSNDKLRLNRWNDTWHTTLKEKTNVQIGIKTPEKLRLSEMTKVTG